MNLLSKALKAAREFNNIKIELNEKLEDGFIVTYLHHCFIVLEAQDGCVYYVGSKNDLNPFLKPQYRIASVDD